MSSFLKKKNQTKISKKLPYIYLTGITVTNQQDVLQEIKTFYQTFYSNKDNELCYVNLQDIVKKFYLTTPWLKN